MQLGSQARRERQQLRHHQVQGDDRAGQPDPVAQTPASERRAVKVGLSNSESVEIVDGLKAGEQVLVKDVVSTFNPNQPQ